MQNPEQMAEDFLYPCKKEKSGGTPLAVPASLAENGGGRKEGPEDEETFVKETLV